VARLTGRELFYAIASPARLVKPAVNESAKTNGGFVPVANVAPANVGPPLGLKYTILKYSSDQATEVPVPADTVFQAGDRIRISVETNQPGFLYIVNQGSSGKWQLLFPSADVDDGNNHVEGFRDYLLPPKSRMVFDEQAGNEKLFIVFSREPETALEEMIYSPEATEPSAGPKKGGAAANNPMPRNRFLVAKSIDDETIVSMRTVYRRNLVVEKVDDGNPGARKETAVYVVNPSGSSDSHVVADLQLSHK
jgi:hypothetical protein